MEYEWKFYNGDKKDGNTKSVDVTIEATAVGKSFEATLFVKDANGATGNAKVTLHSPRIEIVELGFSGDHKLKKWEGVTPIDPNDTSPIWKKTSNPGHPVAYTKNATPTAFATFLVQPSDLPAITVTLQAKKGTDILVSKAGVTMSGGNISVSEIGFSAAVTDKVEPLDLSLTWEYSEDSATFTEIGSTNGIKYFSLEGTPDPSKVLNLLDRAL